MDYSLKGCLSLVNILVTGGTGFIGSHTCVALLQAGYSVVVLDNLCNSQAETVKKIQQITKKEVIFYKGDVTEESVVGNVFSSHRIEGVIHFAGLKSIGESQKKPLDYYYNNVISTIVLAKQCIKHGVNKFVFSSSATVYGNNTVPFVETMKLQHTTNPYGETKAISERILTDISKANPQLSISLLRYFNPVGAHKSALIGESPRGIPNNIMPIITQVAIGKIEQLKIFGNDYPTIDGTGVRDYIHVMDLAEGHVAAFDNLRNGVNIYNLGTGKGTSVMQLVQTFEQVNGVKIPYEVIARRPGDIAICYADINKAKKELGWIPKRSLAEIVEDAWRFEQYNFKSNG